ncbi:FMN reductase [Rhizobium rhizosphaerae]|uniref:FMN reductase n=1 Tax=Xaviernesmea rhizosphaerae TaxID=1672749 RepID=A0A1Q9AK05_9HYPH|nr:NAD(P)H-dependent oxidoreductase [Xaviernesmea rhizosphaerae]OLP55610.1 FMN reductase [Xaviernesmea rhizosphaerae]
MNIVAINGSTSKPSRTGDVVTILADAVSRRLSAPVDRVDLADAAPVLFRALKSDGLDAEGRAIIDKVETADVLIVASPVYRASYTGALKHLFDLVDYRLFSGKIVVLAATGGTPLHGLMIDHQLRPLFAFFNTIVVPTSIYATVADFVDHRLVNDAVAARVERVAEEVQALAGRLGPAAQPDGKPVRPFGTVQKDSRDLVHP